MPITRAAGWLVGLALISSCAKPAIVQPPVFPAEELARADARLAEGCYSCLTEARGIYARLAAGPFRSDVLPRLFETELLLVLRHKELAMPFAEVRSEAGRTALELPASLEAARYLDIVDAIPEDSVGVSERESFAFIRNSADFRRRAEGEAAWLEQGPLRDIVRRYLLMSLQCVEDLLPAPGRSTSDDGDRVQADEAPLVTYRAGFCGTKSSAARLEVVRALVTEHHEAAYFLARNWLASAAKFGTAKPAAVLSEVRPLFPESSSMAYSAGTIQQARNNCEAALRFYDETLALRPQHENAMLGRVMCLSHLKRHDEAIRAATDLIAAGGSTRAVAHYWRAWNHHRLLAFPLARQDTDAAKRAGSSVEIFTLAGIVEYDQDDFEPSMADLGVALKMSSGRACAAHWYLALVHVKKRSWPDSSRSFENAMKCYGANVALSRFALGGLLKDQEVEAEFKAQQIAQLEASIVEDESQRHAAAINAAKGFAMIGDFDTAVRLGTIALEDPALASEVDVLREYLTARRSSVQLPPAVAPVP